MAVRRSLLEAGQLDLFEQASPSPQHWPVRVSNRAKHLRINVHPNGRVEVVAPRRVGPDEVEQFVTASRGWVERQLVDVKPVDRRLPKRLRLPAIERSLWVSYLPTTGVDGWRLCGADQLQIRANDPSAMLRDWLKQTAREDLSSRVEQLAEHTGLAYRRLQWRLQKTRWGSCSSQGTVSLNAAMLLLSRRLADYVMLHELCHLRYMSHGVRFWGLLSRHCGEDARALDRELNQSAVERLGWLHG